MEESWIFTVAGWQRLGGQQFGYHFIRFYACRKTRAVALTPLAGAWPHFDPKLFTQADLVPWARQWVWLTTDIEDVVPLQPFDEEEPVQGDLSAAFFTEWARTEAGLPGCGYAEAGMRHWN